jgi:putative zinc finger protein
MSHVDEGTLHAYLDGELPPVERERVDTHLKGCPACQARLAEERALIERASKLLGMATPPERTMPPLQELRQPRLTWRLRRPLAWAATVLLAIGLGWIARGTIQQRAAPASPSDEARAFLRGPAPAPVADNPAATAPPDTRLATRGEPRSMDTSSKDRDAQHQLAVAPTTGAATNAVVTQESITVVTGALAHRNLDAAAQLPPSAPAIAVRGARAPAPKAEAAQVATGSLYGSAARERAPAIMSSEWPLIARQPARDVLGVEPVVIPGFAVRAYRRNPAAREIVVEQITDAGTAISLIERRVDSFDYRRADSAVADESRAMAKSVNERLARFVGLLRVEIDGPLTPDSLSSLLELAR